MKTLRLSFLALVFIFCSCSSDDSDDTNVTTNDLSGTWVSSDANFNGNAEVPFESEIFTVGFTGESTFSDHKLIFSDTSDLFASEGSYDIAWTFSILGISRTEVTNDIEFLGAGTWVKNGNNLTLTVEGDVTEFQITTLTDTKLVIKSTTLDNLVENADFSFESLEAVFEFEKQ